MSKHTPGPWSVVDEGHAEQGRPAHVRALRLHIVVDHAEDFGDPAPDARLIAAAPDLLEALKAVALRHDYSYLDKGIGTATGEGKAWLAARAAIKKAEAE